MPPTPPPPARRGPSASDLLHGLGLRPDGPVLWGSSLRSARPGVFVVEVPAPVTAAPIDFGALRLWLERVPGLGLDGATPTPHELAARLGTYWLPGETVVFIGSTAKSLGGRVRALMATEIGDRQPFGSAHRLRLLKDVPKLRIWWAETGAAEEYADALFGAFAAGVDPTWAARLPDHGLVLPFGNVEAPDGRKEAHGLTDLFRPDAESARTPGVPASGAAGGPMTKPSARAKAAAASRAAAGPRPRRVVPKAAPRPAGGVLPPTHLTGAGHEALQAELVELTTLRRPEIVARIKAARELGDLRENSDYQEARREQSFLEGRVAQIGQMLHDVVLIDEVERTHVAGMGSTVLVEHDGVEEEYTIVGPAEAKPAERRISDTSPLGQALRGAAAGDDIVVKAPSGDRHYRVLEVR
jgi:transcription elongation factor GreA